MNFYFNYFSVIEREQSICRVTLSLSCRIKNISLSMPRRQIKCCKNLRVRGDVCIFVKGKNTRTMKR